jgi:hypothetical protein
VRLDGRGVRGEDIPAGGGLGRAVTGAQQEDFQQRPQYRGAAGKRAGAGRVVLAAQVVGGEADQCRASGLPPGDRAEGVGSRGAVRDGWKSARCTGGRLLPAGMVRRQANVVTSMPPSGAPPAS